MQLKEEIQHMSKLVCDSSETGTPKWLFVSIGCTLLLKL